ncbi:hypothetical protein DOS63_03170 [Staphylococcus felis]|uniref:hypothetical protein n=1 Tax=Staphylococcus felis TaxID=46127 RepID=UPI000E27B1B5|nr:hypothetical protein [Staphylococcus felis]REH86727.1 hypothetical protein DOS63_03170 [Staphylococcus felis]
MEQSNIIYTPSRSTIESLFGSHLPGDASTPGLDAHPIPSPVSPTIGRDMNVVLHYNTLNKRHFSII